MKKIHLIVTVATVLCIVCVCFGACTSDKTTETDVSDRAGDASYAADSTDTEAYISAGTDVYIPDEIIPEEELLELGGDYEFYHFDYGNCILAYNESGAWIFDYLINKVTPIVDTDAMLAAADRTGRGGEYFDNVSITYDFVMNKDLELGIFFNVTSRENDAHYTVYGFYTMFSEGFESFGYTRGDFRGYYLEEISYPGSDEPVVIYDVNDYEKLGVREDDWLFLTACAFIENDIEELEYRLGVQSGALSEWEGMVISDYSITNQDANAQFIDGLSVYLNITESGVERYPAGEYEVRIVDGLGTHVTFTPLNGENTDESYSEAADWLYVYASRYGGSMPPSEQQITNYSYAHLLVDFYLYSNEFDFEKISWEGFCEFCRVHFGIEVTEDHVSVADVESHGGHGGGAVCCEIVDELSASGVHIITVNYYADPMKSKVAYTHVFTVVENDGFQVDSCERTYDANLRPESWGA